MTGHTKKQIEFLKTIDDAKVPPTIGELEVALAQSRSSITQRLKHCEGNNLVSAIGHGPMMVYVLSEAGKRAINGHAHSPESLKKSVERLAQAWPFHLHEVNLGSGYGGDIHNRYDRPVASFRNIERAKAFLAVMTELLRDHA